jgi:heme exporter protein B
MKKMLKNATLGVEATERSRRAPSWGRRALLLLKKDLLLELRSGEVVVMSGFFALLVIVLASLAFYGGPASGRKVAAGALWLSIAFASVLGLGKTWQRERDESALDGLLVTPLSRSALFTGKFLGVLLFLGSVELVIVPVALLLFALEPLAVGPGLAVVSAFATPGIAAAGTLFGAMTVRTRARDLMLAVVLFPLLSPVLVTSVVATRELFNGVPLSELGDYLKLIGAFDVAFLAGGLGLFGTLIER